MKKTSKILAVGLSCAFAFSLAACGGDDTPVVPGTTPAPNPDSVVTEQVSAAEWAAAFSGIDATNVTFKRTMIDTEDGVTYDAYELVKLDGKKIYYESEDYDYWGEDSNGYAVTSAAQQPQKVLYKSYFYVDGSAVTEYNYNETAGKWTSETEEDGYYPEISDYEYMGSFKKYAALYSEFTYDSAANAYVAGDLDNTDGLIYDSISVKITNGKLSVIEVTGSEYDGAVRHTEYYQLYDYGTTSVTLPTVSGGGDKPPAISSNNEVDAAGWTAALSASAFVNVTTTAITDDDNGVATIIFKNDGANKRVSMEATGLSNIIAFVDGEYYNYMNLLDTGWFRSLANADDFAKMMHYESIYTEQFEYEDFTYDESTHSYKADEYTVDSPEGEETLTDITLKFLDGKLMYLEFNVVDEDGTDDILIMAFSDYGTTTIELPSSYTDVPVDSDTPGPDAITPEEKGGNSDK